MIKESTYRILLEEIEEMFYPEPAPETTEGQLFNAMVTIIELYEIETYGRWCEKSETFPETKLRIPMTAVKWNSDTLFLPDRPVYWCVDFIPNYPSNGKYLFFWQD